MFDGNLVKSCIRSTSHFIQSCREKKCATVTKSTNTLCPLCVSTRAHSCAQRPLGPVCCAGIAQDFDTFVLATAILRSAFKLLPRHSRVPPRRLSIRPVCSVQVCLSDKHVHMHSLPVTRGHTLVVTRGRTSRRLVICGNNTTLPFNRCSIAMSVTEGFLWNVHSVLHRWQYI